MTSATTAQPTPIPVSAPGAPPRQNGNGHGLAPPLSTTPAASSLDVDIDAVIQMATSRAAAAGSGVRSPNGRDTRTQLYVGNLPYRVRWQDLKDLFRKAGTVLRADVSLGSDNRSRGYGTVLLATAEDAGRAIDLFNGYIWQSRTLEVRPDRLPPLEGESTSLAQPGAVQPPHTGPSPLHALPYVPPSSHPPSSWLGVDGAISRPHSSANTPFPDLLPGGLEPARPGSSRSFSATLRRSSTTSVVDGTGEMFTAERELRRGNASPAPGVALSVSGGSPFVYPGKDLPGSTERGTPVGAGLMNGHGGTMGRSVFVGNLPFHVQWQDLKDHFRAAGQIVRADVATGPDGRSRGFGTVLYVHESDALQAVELFNGQEYHGRPLKVHFDKYSAPPGSTPPNLPPLTHSNSTKHYPHPSLTPLPSFSGSVSSHNTTLHSTSYSTSSLPQSISQISMSSGSDFAWPPHGPPHGPPPQLHLGAEFFAPPHGQGSNGGQEDGDASLNMAPLSPGSPITVSHSSSSRHGSIGGGVTHGNPTHPGPISLPPPPTTFMTGGPLSPLMTHGLPPMTPTMPGFMFHPQVQTPPLHPHFLSPGIGPFSPALHGSPFFSHAWNPAPGAPVHMQGPPQSPGSPPPLGGFNPNYPPFIMPQYMAHEMDMGLMDGDVVNLDEDGDHVDFFPPATAPAGDSSGTGTDGTTTEDSASAPESSDGYGHVTGEVGLGVRSTGLEEIGQRSEQGLGLGLVTDVMGKISLATDASAVPTEDGVDVANGVVPSSIKRAQSTTPSSKVQSTTPIPPADSLLLAAGAERKSQVIDGAEEEEEEEVRGSLTRVSLDGLAPPTIKADRRSSWAFGSTAPGAKRF